jgi:TRAP-type C4-dicarboxylate transport system permease small subunit
VQRWRHICAQTCGLLAALCLAAMMLCTVVDVVLRAVFGIPLRGIYEVVELLLAYTFFLALPAVFLRNENIVVNIIDDIAPRWVRPLKRMDLVLSIVVLALIAWQGWLAAMDTIAFNDMTADLNLPRSLHWSALLIGVFGSLVVLLALVWRAPSRP